jgi:hypothetical protein
MEPPPGGCPARQGPTGAVLILTREQEQALSDAIRAAFDLD